MGKMGRGKAQDHSKWDFPRVKKSSFPSVSKVLVFHETGFGVDNLIESILVRLGLGEETEMLSRRRHVACLESCWTSLEKALLSLEGGEGVELVAQSLLMAQNDLGEITRPTSSDDLLGEIFSEFCIGK